MMCYIFKLAPSTHTLLEAAQSSANGSGIFMGGLAIPVVVLLDVAVVIGLDWILAGEEASAERIL